MRAMTSTARVRDRGMQVLFALTAAWAIQSASLIGPDLVWRFLGKLNPFPEGHALHDGAEEILVPLLAIALGAAITATLVRFVPGFLSFPRSVSSARMMITIVVTTIVVGIVLGAVLFGTGLIADPPGPHPEDPQHIPFLFWMAPWVTAMLTPILGLLLAWRWVLWRAHR